MTSLAFALAYAGFLALALARPRHWAQFRTGRELGKGKAMILRLGGWALLAASLLPCLAVEAWGLGLVLWLGLLTAAALLLVFLLPYRPRLAGLLAGLLPPLGLLALVAG